MGLFSFLNKNKQDTTAEDSGYYSRDEDTVATRARSKRASSAGEPATGRGKKSRETDDPVLPEKKRARRRLVGAIALALAVAVGLPMVLDSEPKPLASDIAFQIPSREKAAPLPVPAAPALPALPAVTAADSLDKREQFVEPTKAESTDIKTVSLNSGARAAEPKAEPKAAVLKPETRPEPKIVAKAEPKPEPKAKAEPKPVEPKPVAKPAVKAEEKVAAKPEEATRAQDILEGKAPEAANEKFVVQVAALGSQDKVAELQGKLKAAGIRSFTHKVTTASGERIQVKVGPFSKEEADRMRARLDKVGLSGSLVKPDGK
jgi:DedD protein